MPTVEKSLRPEAARYEEAPVARSEAVRCGQARVTQARLCCGASWVASFRGDSSHELHASVRPEDLARSELFYSLTGAWV